MLALVVLEAVAIGLLGLLVAGLLRSHAEILRRLHALDPPAAQPVAPPLRRQSPRTGAHSLQGVTPGGESVSLALDRPGERTLLLFLSSGCGTCGAWWDGLRHGEHTAALPDTNVVVVAQDPASESPARLAGLAAPGVPVVLSGAAWEEFKVPGSPYAVLVDGRMSGEARADAELLAAGIRPGDPSLYPEPGSWTR
jgi:hypothetical protein